MLAKVRYICPMFVSTGVCMFAKDMGTVKPTFRGPGLPQKIFCARRLTFLLQVKKDPNQKLKMVKFV